MVTYSELLSQELMGDLLFLITRPAAEVGKQLLPVYFVFGLNDITKSFQINMCIKLCTVPW